MGSLLRFSYSDFYADTKTYKVATQAAGGLSFLATRSFNLFRKRIVRIDVYIYFIFLVFCINRNSNKYKLHGLGVLYKRKFKYM